MTEEQTRLSILRLLHRSSAMGLAEDLLKSFLNAEGVATDKDPLRVQVQYLEDKGLVVEVDKTISPENKRWRLTAAGRDYCAATF